ncbi:unnamed protein product [Closterium sp. NIES-54]
MARLGGSWRGMFMRDDARYDVKNTPSCQGILPASAYVNAPIWDSDAGVSELKLLSELQRKVESNESIPQGLEDFMLKERWLIWMPRFGLGNSLRAYTSAFIFALLSGRRLLRWKGGNHKQVLERLCNAFYCGIDELHYKGDIRKHAKLMNAITLEMHGLNFSPNVVAVYTGNFFEKTWRTDPQMNQCVHSAFGCRSIWCIRSKVLSLLLGKGPKPGVQEVVDRDLRVVPPLVLTGKGVGTEEEEAKGEKVEPQMVTKGEGLRVQFDVSIHIRGLSMEVEGDYCMNKEDKKCQKRAQQQEIMRVHEIMKPTQWRCIARLMQFLRIKKAAAGGFTNATAAAGWSANATAAAGRTSKATTAAVRPESTTAAAGRSADATGGTGRSANATGGIVGPSKGTASHAAANTAPETIKGSKLEKGRKLQQRKRLQDEWTVDDSNLVASIVPLGGPSATRLGHLRIFVATDTDTVRSKVVEFLRPFGEVYFSVSPPMHLSKGVGNYLATLADFALLSKGAVLVSFTRFTSSFSFFAGLLGNGTIVNNPAVDHTCSFVVEHMGELWP